MRTISPTAMLTIFLLIDCRIINRCSLTLQGNPAGSAPCSAHCGWMVGESVQLLDDFPRCVDVCTSQDGTQPHPQHNERSNAQPDLTAANISRRVEKWTGSRWCAIATDRRAGMWLK